MPSENTTVHIKEVSLYYSARYVFPFSDCSLMVFCSLKILFKVRNGNSQESESWLACKSLGQGLGCPSKMVCSEFPQPFAASTLLLLCLLLCCAFLSPTYSKSTRLSKVVSNSLWYLSGMLWVYLCDVVVVCWFLMHYISYCICHLGGSLIMHWFVL